MARLSSGFTKGGRYMINSTNLQKQAEELRDKLKKALQEKKLNQVDILKMSDELDEMLNLISNHYYIH